MQKKIIFIKFIFLKFVLIEYLIYIPLKRKFYYFSWHWSLFNIMLYSYLFICTFIVFLNSSTFREGRNFSFFTTLWNSILQIVYRCVGLYYLGITPTDLILKLFHYDSFHRTSIPRNVLPFLSLGFWLD